jgi:hypothetical protein
MVWWPEFELIQMSGGLVLNFTLVVWWPEFELIQRSGGLVLNFTLSGGLVA